MQFHLIQLQRQKVAEKATEELRQAKIKTQSDAYDLAKKQRDDLFDKAKAIAEQRGAVETGDGAGKIEAAALSVARFSDVARQIAGQVGSVTVTEAPVEVLNSVFGDFPALDEAKLCEMPSPRAAAQGAAAQDAAAQGAPTLSAPAPKTLLIASANWQPDVTGMVALADEYELLVARWQKLYGQITSNVNKRKVIDKYSDEIKDPNRQYKSQYIIHYTGSFRENEASDPARLAASVGPSLSQSQGQPKTLIGAIPLIGETALIASAFKTDVVVSSLDLTKGDMMMVNSLTEQVWTGWNVYRPEMLQPGSATRSLVKALSVDLENVIGTKRAGLQADRAASTKLAPLAKEVAGLLKTAKGAKKVRLKELQKEIATTAAKWANEVDDAEAALNAIAEFRSNSLLPTKDKLAPITVAARSLEQICLTRGNSAILRVAVTAYGGTTLVRKNFFTSFGVPWFVSSGVVASYSVQDAATGKILKSGNVSSLGKLTPIRKIKSVDQSE